MISTMDISTLKEDFTCDSVRFGNKTRFTSTNGIASIVNIAPGTWATWVGLTWVWLGHTFVSSAYQTHSTLWVNCTLWLAPSDGVWVG